MDFRRLPTASRQPRLVCTCVALLALLLLSQDAQAQMFGQRSLGQPLNRRPGAAAAANSEAPGTLQGNERFMRENRSRNDFVGSNQASQRGFVGSEQAIGAGRVPTAAESLPAITDDSRRINRPLAPLGPDEIYYPHLTIDLPTPRQTKLATENLRSNAANLPTPDNRLQQRVAADTPNVRIHRNGNTAILSGTVTDPRQATRLRLLLSFEPGVYTIQDKLQIVNQ